MKLSKILFLFVLLPVMLIADQQVSPVGRWITIDDKTKEESSIMVLWTDEKGILYGKVEKVIAKPGEDPFPLCDKCSGEFKDKPVTGLKIMWNFVAKKGNPDKWVSGKILDPDDGNIYSCELTLHDGGNTLEVRGYIGIPWIGRSQTWIRAKN